MKRVVFALILFGVGAFFAGQTRDGYRGGAMPLLISSRVSPLVFDRFQAPSWFWAATAINVLVAAAMMLAGVLILAVGVQP